MEIRHRIFPRDPLSIGACLFIVCVIPLVYWFEMCIILPSFYDMSSPYFWWHLVFGHFLMVNVMGSYIGLLLIDNTVERNARCQKDNHPDWRHCNICNIKVPPRSWHCSICDRCMLKRDHHCFFAGYCIGHHNHRMFMMFLFYVLIGCVYITYYNFFYLIERLEFSHIVFRTIFSLPLILSEKKIDVTHVYLLIFYLIIGGLVLSLILFIYHVKLLLKGCVGYESKNNILKYNLGTKRNFITVFGEKWYVSWLCPFIYSKLPTDGFYWEINAIQTKEL